LRRSARPGFVISRSHTGVCSLLLPRHDARSIHNPSKKARRHSCMLAPLGRFAPSRVYGIVHYSSWRVASLPPPIFRIASLADFPTVERHEVTHTVVPKVPPALAHNGTISAHWHRLGASRPRGYMELYIIPLGGSGATRQEGSGERSKPRLIPFHIPARGRQHPSGSPA